MPLSEARRAAAKADAQDQIQNLWRRLIAATEEVNEHIARRHDLKKDLVAAADLLGIHGAALTSEDLFQLKAAANNLSDRAGHDRLDIGQMRALLGNLVNAATKAQKA